MDKKEEKELLKMTPEERYLGFRDGHKGLRKTLLEKEILKSEKQVKVMEGILAGKTKQVIAQELGMSLAGVQYYEQVVLKEFTRDLGFKVPHYQAIQNARIENVMEKVYENAVSGDLSSVDRFIALSKRQADLLGLDAPKKVAQTDPSGTKEFGSLSFEERLSQINKIIQQAQARGVQIQDHPPENTESNGQAALPDVLYYNEPDVRQSEFYYDGDVLEEGKEEE